MARLTSMIFFLFLLFHCNAQKPASLPAKVNRPKLVVGLVIDQMRWDYLYRYYESFGPGGFRRLLDKGFSFDNAFIPYTPAVTAAGHTCLYTGSVPAFHGIIGNDWIENGVPAYCARDLTVQTVGSRSLQGQMSPRNMLSTTVGDELRIATNFKSRVYGVAMKDRGGIFPAGHSANAAYWFDDSTGSWITSTYYMNALPEWVASYNALKRADSFMRNDWQLLNNPDAYTQSTPDDMPYERLIIEDGKRSFPHSYSALIGRNYLPFRSSPYGNTFTLDFARKIIEEEKLGMLNTDMICISLSATDYVGHRFGPNSREVEDMYIRLDRDMAGFLSFLDQKLGVNNYLLFLSADHGAPNSPGYMKANKLPGGSLNAYNMGKEISTALKVKYNADSLVRTLEYQVYLNEKKINALGLNRDSIKKDVTDLLWTRPEIIHVIDYDAFDKTTVPTRLKEMLSKGYFPRRSGDIQFIFKSQYTDVRGEGTDHGAWYPYDTHIPLLWYGWKIPSGSTNREVYMTDVAPTLSALLKIQMPGTSIGQVLTEITSPKK